MKTHLRRYTIFLLLLLFAVGWVLLMSLNMSTGSHAPAADGVEATITWLDLKGVGFPHIEAHLLVMDRAGNLMRGLSQESFEVYEDDFPADIQTFLGAGEQTVLSMLVIDRSGSMDGDKLEGARDAANTFVDQMRPERDRAGLIAFADRVESLQPLTNDVDGLRQSVNEIRAYGGTAFYDAVYQGLLDLQGENGRRIILALTDGLDNESRRTPQEIIQLAQDEGIAIYTVGLGEEGWWIFTELDSENLSLIAEETGGEYHQAPSASELAALYKRIAEVVQNEYVIGYESPTPHLDGTTRQVEIAVVRDEGSVKARSSYAVSGVISSAFNVTLFVPLFAGLFLFLCLLLLIPAVFQRWQRRKVAKMGASQYSSSFTPPQYPAPPAPPQYPAPPVLPQYTTPPATFPCAHCAQPVLVGKKFCSKCGQPVKASSASPPVSLSCRHCGKPLRSGKKFCSHCGQPQ